ncbi:unnamed protein product [Oikopleura dioica]|uniref:Uncharacterized protein n=1 Tax=Oikopleura dioica TaxID=34765 RepID=E4XK84_OIKDI|nr:unnamed protein product [Oikopleura dioica]
MNARDIFGSNSPKKKEIGFKARSKTRNPSGNGSLLGTSINGSTMRIRNVPKKEGRGAPVRIRRRFEKAAVIADIIEDSTNKRPESPKVAVEPTKETENEDLEDSVHLIVPRRRKVDMSKSKSVMMRSKMESTPAASRHKRSNLPGILNEFSIEHASMLGGRMETPKDDSFEKNKISRVAEPIQLQLDEGVENSSYALFGSECSSSEEKSVEVLVPETPLKPKKIGICNRDSSPLKEIHPNKIISCAKPPASRLPTPIFNSVTITGTPLVQEKSSPVKTTPPGPVPLREFASPPKENFAPPEDPFASLDESSFHFHVENTPIKSNMPAENIVEKIVSPKKLSSTTTLQAEPPSEPRNIDLFASLDQTDTINEKPFEKITKRLASNSPVKDISFHFHIQNTPLKSDLPIERVIENDSTSKVIQALPVVNEEREKMSLDEEEKQTNSASKPSMKRKSESTSPTIIPKLQKLDKSRLTINKLDVGNVSKRPKRTIRKRETHELDETPTIRLSQSPVKPESESQKTIVPPKEVKAKPSRTIMRRRRKTSIGETPELRENLPFAKGRRFSRTLVNPCVFNKILKI